jgi:hypothetical protein
MAFNRRPREFRRDDFAGDGKDGARRGSVGDEPRRFGGGGAPGFQRRPHGSGTGKLFVPGAPQPAVDREKTCPFLVRVFCRHGDYRRFVAKRRWVSRERNQRIGRGA